MTIPVCQVTATLVAPDGGAIVGAKVTATLTAPIVYQGLIVPTSQSKTSNQAGRCAMNLWPNSLGASTTTYTFQILIPGQSMPMYFHDITVPNVASITLEQLLGGMSGGAAALTQWLDSLAWNDAMTWQEA